MDKDKFKSTWRTQLIENVLKLKHLMSSVVDCINSLCYYTVIA